MFWHKLQFLARLIDTFLHIPWNAKHFSILVKNIYLNYFEYADSSMLIKPLAVKPGYSVDKCAFSTFWQEAPRRQRAMS